jgi:hypothetical protein
MSVVALGDRFKLVGVERAFEVRGLPYSLVQVSISEPFGPNEGPHEDCFDGIDRRRLGRVRIHLRRLLFQPHRTACMAVR